MSKSLRFIKDFMSLGFWPKTQIGPWCRHGSNFQIWGETIFGVLCFQMIQTDYWRHFISADWVYMYKQKLESYWGFYEFGSLVKNPQNLWCRHGSNFQIWSEDLFGDFMLNKWYRTDYRRHFISTDWVGLYIVRKSLRFI